MKINKNTVLISFIFSVVFNTLFLLYDFKDQKQSKYQNEKKVVIKIRDIGREQAKGTKDIVQLQDLTTHSVDDLLSKKLPNAQKRIQTIPQPKTALQNIKLNKNDIFTPQGENSDLILNSGVKFESKRGIPLDELNSEELVYYGFKNRTAIQYKNAILKNINILKSKHPMLFLKIKDSIHNLSGRISYDRLGNVVNIKILQWSDSNEIQDFFLNSLKDIRSIQNPPEGILDEEGFKAVYQLKLTL